MNTKADNFPDEAALPITSLRMNTAFGKRLIALATESVDSVLSWSTQQLPEPPTEKGNSEEILDLNGANGLYFWELFFHVPWLIAWRLRETRQYRTSSQWCTRHLFDPYRGAAATTEDQTPYWNASPLSINEAVLDESPDDLDPEMPAYMDPGCYRRAVFLFLTEVWRMEGDDLYRQMTRDSLEEAWFCYEKALRLIGTLPEPLADEIWKPVTLAQVTDGMFAGTADRAITDARTRLCQRMSNLRHGLSIDGKRVNLPFYADAESIGKLANWRTGLSATGALPGTLHVPEYRFAQVVEVARSAALQLTDMGRHLFKVYESEFDAGLAVMLQADAITLNEYAIGLNRTALAAARTGRDRLMAGQRMIELRRDRFQRLVEGGLSFQEETSLSLRMASQYMKIASMPFSISQAATDSIPNIFGMAVGGQKLSAFIQAGKEVIDTTSAMLGFASDVLATTGGYERRDAEWRFELASAQAELEVSARALQEQQLSIDASQQSLDESLTRHTLMRDEYVFMTTGFAIGPTYIWMIANLTAIYAATYDAVYSLCMDAEAAFQYETGDFSASFVKAGAWLDAWRGMQAGEALQRDLLTMQSAFMHANERHILIAREISLAALRGNGSAQAGREAIHSELEKESATSFSLTEALFDDDYPGHYLRRLRNVSISLVFDDAIGDTGVVPGSALLTQTASTIVLRPSMDSVKRLYDANQGNEDNLLRDARPHQQVALSGLGMPSDLHRSETELNKVWFGDHRLLPFEGTGAVSQWTLSFPGRSSGWRTALKDEKGAWRLRDIIVRIHYTAMAGNDTFTRDVKSLKENSTEAKGVSTENVAAKPSVSPVPESASVTDTIPEAIADSVVTEKQVDAFLTTLYQAYGVFKPQSPERAPSVKTFYSSEPPDSILDSEFKILQRSQKWTVSKAIVTIEARLVGQRSPGPTDRCYDHLEVDVSGPQWQIRTHTRSAYE